MADEERHTRITRVLGASTIAGSEGVLILRILSGELKGNEAIILGHEPFIIGSGFETTLRLPDLSVSRKHLELVNKGGVVTAKDLGSTNGSYFEGSRFEAINLQPGAVFQVGETELQLVAPEKSDPLPPSQAAAFGPLLGKSRRMREVFAVLERASKTDATVLISGETGTGKEVVAEAIHQASKRAKQPFIVVDCASIPATLIESELFGHVKGAFTNAVTDRIGAFEAANGGTIFLDELGELPAALQPRLLRVLETRRVKPVGSNENRPIDVRVIAATNRALETEVRERRFRSDLYFRLAVVRVNLPPLRERREDIVVLAQSFLDRSGKAGLELTPEIIAALTSYDWPGNVRELRNVIDQATSLSSEGLNLALRLKSRPRSQTGGGTTTDPAVEAMAFSRFFGLPYKEARRQALEAFELAYAQNVVAQAGGNVTKAADTAQVHRNVLHRILARGRGEPPPDESTDEHEILDE
ncbi:MAG: sigma 54-dependent Fis family transcriptional regulator [Deltaproteobacteria bacterium]|nr:sigma 54-dependent Fis family transcriptional regulator [Deltaproteobacteria bacterium]